MRTPMKRVSGSNILFLLILAFVFGLATYKLTESPVTGYDEGLLTQLAGYFAEHNMFAMQLAPGRLTSGAYMSTGFPVLLPIGLYMKAVGVGHLQARTVMVAFMIGFISLFYLLAKKETSTKFALFATALMATHGSLYYYGKGVFGEIPGLFYFMTFLLLFHRAEKEQFKKPLTIGLAGALLGLTIVTKPVFLLAVPAVFLVLLFTDWKLLLKPKVVLPALVGLLIPFAVWFKTQFFPTDDAGMVLEFYRNPYQIADVGRNIVNNLKLFVTQRTPMYVLILFVTWTLALIVGKIRKDARSKTEYVAWMFSFLILLAFLRMPALFRYFFLANAVMLLYTPSSLGTLVRFTAEILHRRNITIPALLRGATYLPVIALIAFHTHSLFFTSWISNYYGSTQSYTLTEYFRDADPNRVVFMYEAPEIYLFLPHRNYYQFIRPSGLDSLALGTENLELLRQGTPDVVVVEKNFLSDPSLFAKYEIKTELDRYFVFTHADQP